MKEMTKKTISIIVEEVGAWTAVGLFVFVAIKLLESIF
jgi:hypothetical protein